MKLKGVKRMYSLQGAYPREDKTKIKKEKKKNARKCVFPGTTRRGGKICGPGTTRQDRNNGHKSQLNISKSYKIWVQSPHLIFGHTAQLCTLPIACNGPKGKWAPLRPMCDMTTEWPVAPATPTEYCYREGLGPAIFPFPNCLRVFQP